MPGGSEVYRAVKREQMRNWLEQELISPADYRRMDKVLVKKYGFSDKSIFRPECRRLLEK